jgi:hypothetical protein
MKIRKISLITLACMLTASAVFAQRDAKSLENERWNSTPNDVNNLLKCVKSLVDANYQMEVKGLDEVDPNPEQNPLLFYSGHYNYEFTAGQRQKLRKFMLDGGMVLFNTGLGSAPFYRSTVRELEQIFPEQPVERLSPDHPIFYSYYKLDRVQYSPGVYKTGFKGNEPWFDGVTINCRTMALVSRFGMGVGWDGGEVAPQYAAYMPESAQKLGVNIFSYATANRAWAKNMASKMKFMDREKSSTGKMSMVQVVYNGVWKTRHAGMSVLLQTFNKKTEVPVKFGLKETSLNDKSIFNAPLLFMCGHENFKLPAAEIANLRKYLKNGGFLFGEACCGRKGFDLSFRQMLSQAMPETPLRKIPASDIIYMVPHKVTQVGVTPQLAAQSGEAVTSPHLEALEIEGHYGVIYSKYGLQGGWEMSASPYAHGYNEASSIKLGQNVLMYAITQ